MSRTAPRAAAARVPLLDESDPLVQVVPARFVRLELGYLITGYTTKAMYRKIEQGVWQEAQEWVRAPDGHILLDRFGYERWAVSNYSARRSSRRSSVKSTV